MARPAGAAVHVGKAAALIVAVVLLAALVMADATPFGWFRPAAEPDAINIVTPTTLGEATTTTSGALRAPSTIKVVAVNATGRAGVAGQATTKLQQAGYNAVQPGNATASVRASRPASLIYVVTAGFEREAREVAALFGLPDSAVRALPSPSPSADIKGDVNIAVLVGSGITI